MIKIILIVTLIAVVPSDASLVKKLLLKKAIAAKLGIGTPFLLRTLLTGESLLPSFGSMGVAGVGSDSGGSSAAVGGGVAADVDSDVAHVEVDDSEVIEAEPEPEPEAELEAESEPELEPELEPESEATNEESPSVESASVQYNTPSHYFVPVRPYTIAYPYPYSYSFAQPRFVYGVPPSW